MNDSARLGRIAGVDVGLHWSLLLIGGLLAEQLARGRFRAGAPGYSGIEYLLAAGITVLGFLACVLAHELGHAVVARREGIGVDGITLWFLGGVTRMTSEATTPKAELTVAGAGPLTSFVLGAVIVGLAVAARAGAVSPLLVDALGWLGVINVVIAVFNTLPGAPLDGGRLLHAFVWSRRGDRRGATRAATRAGRAIGALLIASAVVDLASRAPVGTGAWLALVGWFLYAGARVEEEDADAREALDDTTVAAVMTRNVLVVGAGVGVGEFLESTSRSRSKEVFPVQDRDGTLLGVVSPKQLRHAPRARRPATRIGDVVRPLPDISTVGPDELATVLLDRVGFDDDGLTLVLDGGHLVGVVRPRDVARAIARRHALRRQSSLES